VNSSISNKKEVKQFRLATFAHEAAKDAETERQAAEIIKKKIEKIGISDGVRVTEEMINNSIHTFTAVPSKFTDLPPETGDVAVVPNMDVNSKKSDSGWHVAVVTAKDARNL
jgi:hypothetical protein